MKIHPAAILAAALVAVSPMAALAQANTSVEFRTLRLAQDDLPKAADFYKKVFGLSEIQRAENQIVLNLSSSSLRPTPRFALAKRQPGQAADTVAHVIFNVMDFNGVMGRVTANGGTIQRPGALSGIGNMVGFVKDPGGNIVEIVGPAPGKTVIN